MKKIIIFVQLVLSFSLFSAVETRHTTTNSGLFSSASTWTLGVVPSWGDSWTIMPGHTLEYDLTNELTAGAYGATFPTNAWGLCTNNGTLSITNTAYLKFTNNLSGTGQWFIGSESVPIVSLPDRIDRVVVEWGDRGSCTMTGTNTVKFYGDTNFFFSYTSNYTLIGETNLFFTNNVIGVKSNDIIYISNPNTRSIGGSNYLVYAVNTNCISLYSSIPAASPHTNNWTGVIYSKIGLNLTNALVVKLSRPVSFIQRQPIVNVGAFTQVKYMDYISGVRFSGLGRPAYSAASIGVSMVSCTGDSVGSASFVYTGTGFLLDRCASVGMLIFAGNLCSVNNCVIVNSSGGGSGGNYLTFNKTTAANCANGGISVLGNGIIANGCIVNNSRLGVLNSCRDSSIIDCISKNPDNSGLVTTCDSSIIINSYIVNNDLNTEDVVGCGGVIISGTNRVRIPLVNVFSKYSVANKNYTNFYGATGTASVGTDKTITFYPSNALAFPVNSEATVVAYTPISIKSVLKPTVSLFLTNGLSYQVVTDRSLIPNVNNATVYTNTTGWTNISLSLTNNYPMSIDSQYLYVICTIQNSGTNGMAKITVPTEYQTRFVP